MSIERVSSNKTTPEKTGKELLATINEVTTSKDIEPVIENGQIPVVDDTDVATEETNVPLSVICCMCNKVVAFNETKPRGDYFICNDCSGSKVKYNINNAPNQPGNYNATINDVNVTEDGVNVTIDVDTTPNYVTFLPVNKDEGMKYAAARAWRVVLLLELFKVTPENTFVAYQDTSKMPEDMAKAINVIEQNIPTAIINPVSQTVINKGKTQGIYEITSKFNTPDKFSLRGSSSQIEVCTRDYMSWCLKDKAPKSMQTEFDRVKKENKELDPKKIFNVTILKTVSKIDDLKAAKEEFGINNKGGKPQTNGGNQNVSLSPEESLETIQTLDETQKNEKEI